jgi:hypothetical protein
MTAYTTILGGHEPLTIGERYRSDDVERDGQHYPDLEFVVLRDSSLTELLQQVSERGKSLTPAPHQVDGHYYLVQFDSEPPWLESESAEPATA